MPVLKEFRCAAHGAFENTDGECPWGCPSSFVAREIRTAPAYRSGVMKNTDGNLRAIAEQQGLTDLKNDTKDGSNMMQNLRKGRVVKSTWIDVPHAAPGFSRDPNAKIPTVTAQQYGAVGETRNLTGALPKLKPLIVGSYKE